MILGLSIAEWVQLLQGILAFPKSVLQVVQALQKTPEQQHDDLIKAIQAEADKIKQTGRPTWG